MNSLSGKVKSKKRKKKKRHAYFSNEKIDLIETCIWNDMDDINVNIEE